MWGGNFQLKIKMRGTAYTVVVSAASAPKPDKSNNPLGSQLVVPYWLVRPTLDRDKANMHMGTLKSTLTIAVGKDGNDSAEEAVMIPILVNHKAIQDGDELVVYKDDDTKKESLAPAPKPAPKPEPAPEPKPAPKQEPPPPGHKRSMPVSRSRLTRPAKKA